MEGWIKIHRIIQNHWVFQNDKYFKWWIIVLLNVNYSPSKFPVNSELQICNPGQSFNSIERWGRLFNCSKKTVLKFFSLLENDDMISRKIIGKGNRRKHLLTIQNWGKFQEIVSETVPKTEPESIPKRNPKLPPIKEVKKLRSKEVKNNINVHFEDFWNLYDKKINRKDSERKWNKLTDQERTLIIETLPTWLKQFSEKQFQPFPTTFFNQRRWEDEPPREKINYDLPPEFYKII